MHILAFNQSVHVCDFKISWLLDTQISLNYLLLSLHHPLLDSVIAERQQGLDLQPGHEPTGNHHRLRLHRKGAARVGSAHVPQTHETQGPHR